MSSSGWHAALAGLTILACTEAPSPGRSRSGAAPSESAWDDSSMARALAVPPDSLRAAGEERYGRAAYDSARLIFRSARARAERLGDRTAAARAEHWLAAVAWRQFEYDAARKHGQTALALKRANRLDGELSVSYNLLGLVAWNEARYTEALERYDSAVVTASRHVDTIGVAKAEANRALVWADLGEFPRARGAYLAAIAAGRALGETRLEANAMTNLAALEIRLGRPEAALELLGHARERYLRIGYPTGEQNALGQMATALGTLGELQRAISVAESALAITREHRLPFEEAATLEVLADLRAQAGEPQRALALVRAADTTYGALDMATERGSNLRRQALLVDALDGPTGALQPAREALSRHAAAGASAEAFEDLVLLTDLHRRLGWRDSARASLDSARLIARHSRSPRAGRDLAFLAARLALDDGHPRIALRQLEQAGDDWAAWDLRAEASAALGDWQAAQRAGTTAVARLERERASLGEGARRGRFLAGRSAPLSRLIATRLRLGDTTAAFALAAGVPGRGLVEHLAGLAGGAVKSLEALANGERLLRSIAALEAELDGSDDGAGETRRDAIARQLLEAREGYEDQLLRSSQPPGAAVLGLGRADPVRLAAALADDEALLTWFAGPERLDGFALTRGKIFHASVPIGARELVLRIRRMRELLGAAAGDSSAARALTELHGMLIAPMASAGALGGVRRLVLVPPGTLSALPFAALRDGRTGRFLVQDLTLLQVPAAAAIPMLRERPAHGTGPVEVFVPLDGALPGSRREGRAILRLLPSARLHSGPRANLTTFVRALAAGGIVHLASHGEFDPVNPMFSRVTLADRHLEVHRVLDLPITSPLVFLDGCETALGLAGNTAFGPTGDEGSLAQAFLYAGARNVVATLWRIDDADAARFAERFYRHGGTDDPARALARAQRESLTAGPGLEWAAYVAYGAGVR